MSNINEMNQGPKWYVAHTYTGYENKVKDNIEKIVENRGLGHLIYDVKVPIVTSTVTNDKGEEKIVEEKLFPSYVFVKMTMTDESWHVVRNISGVTGFVGPGSEPTPLTDEEIERLVRDKMDADVWCIELKEEQIKKAQARGLKVNCWTVNEKENGEKFASWGIDFITSNILE